MKDINWLVLGLIDYRAYLSVDNLAHLSKCR